MLPTRAFKCDLKMPFNTNIFDMFMNFKHDCNAKWDTVAPIRKLLLQFHNSLEDFWFFEAKKLTGILYGIMENKFELSVVFNAKIKLFSFKFDT